MKKLLIINTLPEDDPAVSSALEAAVLENGIGMFAICDKRNLRFQP